MVHEFANIVWKNYNRNQITRHHAQEMSRDVVNYFHLFHSAFTLNRQALDIAIDIKHPVYDCIYIACAEAIHAPLVTDDQKLFRAVQGTVYQDLVVLLDNPKLFD